MNFRKFLITLCFVSLTALVAAETAQDRLDIGKEQFYIHADKGWPAVAPEKSHLNQVIGLLSQKATSILSREEFDELAIKMEQDFDKGTCYGQAMNFMLTHPFYSKEIAMPKSDLDKRGILFFQARNSIGSHMLEKQIEAEETFVNYFAAYHPELNIPRGKWHEIDLKKEEGLAAKDPVRTKAYASLLKQLTTFSHLSAFLKEHEKYLEKLVSAAQFKPLPSHTISTEGKTLEQVEDAMMDAFYAIIGGPFATDAIICISPKEEGAPGHAILWQIAHKRIYDSEWGLYQYESLVDPILDVMFLPEIEAADSITFYPYTWSGASGNTQ